MRRSLAVLTLAGAALLGAAPAARVLPRPAEVLPLPGDAPNALVLAPSVAVVPLGPGEGAPVVHRLANGGDTSLDLDLDAVPVVPGAGGAPVATPEATSDLSLVLGEDRLSLGGREVATLTSALRAGASLHHWEALALTATADGVSPATAVTGYVVAGPPAPAPAVTATAGIDTSASPLAVTVTVHDPGQRLAVVDLRVRAEAWWGRPVLDETVRDVLVWPNAARTLTVPLTGEVVPGPYTVEVVAADHDGPTAHATTRTWVWGHAPLLLGALALLVVTAVLVGRAWHRRSRAEVDDLPSE